MTDGGGWCWKRAHFSFIGWLLGVCPCYSNYRDITSCRVFSFLRVGKQTWEKWEARAFGVHYMKFPNIKLYIFICMYVCIKYMESPQNRWNNDSARLLSPLNITSIASNKFNLSKLWAKRGTHGNPQMTQVIPKLLVVLQKLIVMPCFCRQQLHKSLNMRSQASA